MGYEPLVKKDDEQHPKDQQPKKKETPFDFIDEILADLKNYESQVEEFTSTPRTSDDKGYRFLDEMLTLCILRLDCIETDGDEKLRQHRKQAINQVNRVAAILESKVKSKQEPQQTDIVKPEEDKIKENPTTGATEEIDNESNKNNKKTKKEGGGKRFLFLKSKKNKNNHDLDGNNNKTGVNQSESAVSDDASTSVTSSSTSLQGKETEV